MTKIKMFGARAEEQPIAQRWAQSHHVTVDMTDEIINEQTVDGIKGYDGVTTLQVADLPEDAYAKLKSFGIKQVAQRSAGFDMYDLAKAKENGIIITNVPSYSPESIAEYAVTTALDLVRRVPRIQQRVKEHNFTWQPPIQGRVVGNMTVAVIGTGHIGALTAKLFHGFGAKVVGYDFYPNDQLRSFIDYQDSVTAAVKDADIVTIHMPATAENHHMFNYDLFKQFKPGAILINMARGALVDTTDLLRALDEGLLDSAGLDVYEKEGPYVPNDMRGKQIDDELFQKVLDNDKIIYSPHIAYYTDEAVKNLVEGGLDATMEVLETGDSKFRVN
ncbi:D-2-hydroxyacid dehydrogenase [Limosilactobacillus avium]|uniref:D-2-hydroxyacid dehydrogenase n=1 Tax=Limosilactobacillus avium TaxID=2991831 RepID=UPI0024BB4536|nr:D-2-hydroxyacid dehydrogenase [Limosilactobacillus avium]